MAPPPFLAIVGPTGSGKTELSLEVGRRLGGEVISMDSRQVYRGMDVGTGKVGLKERALLPHHGLDLRDPDQRYSAGEFARDARRWIREIRSRGRVPLLVGGTGFFLRALTHPMFKEPPLDRDRLRGLRRFLSGLSAHRLAEFLEALDPHREVGVPEDRQRATRAIEIALLTGRPLSWWHAESEPTEEPLRGAVMVLDPSRDALYHRINGRVGRMMEEGLVEEVERLLRAGYREEDPGMTGAGYREVVRFLRGALGLEETVEEIRRSHRRYARRQSTWFRHQLPPGAVWLEELETPAALADRVLEVWAAMCAEERA